MADLTHRTDQDHYREIGRGLRSVREDLGVNMGQLADALRCAVGHVSDRELGRVAWSPEMLREHLAALVLASLRGGDRG